MQEQYDMIREQIQGAVCCTNLYGEILELYRDGHLQIPEDVIMIWADNGYARWSPDVRVIIIQECQRCRKKATKVAGNLLSCIVL